MWFWGDLERDTGTSHHHSVGEGVIWVGRGGNLALLKQRQNKNSGTVTAVSLQVGQEARLPPRLH